MCKTAEEIERRPAAQRDLIAIVIVMRRVAKGARVAAEKLDGLNALQEEPRDRTVRHA